MASIQSRTIAPRRTPSGGFASAALIACLLAGGGAPAASSPPSQVHVVTDINYPPYLFQTDDGELQGILKDKWALWSRRTGIPVRLEGMEWTKAQESVQKGAADVIEALSYTEARTRAYEYSPPYAPIDARVFFHRSISGINDVASMRGFSMGAKEGSACAAWLAERGIDMIRGYPSSETLVKAVGAGEVRLFCMDSPTARYFLFKHNLAEEFRETPPLYSTEFHWAVKKGRTELRDFIQSGFGRITARELEDIDARWLGVPLRFQIGERSLYYFALIAAAVLGFSVLLVVWNRTLRFRVSAKTVELSAALETLQTHSDKVRDLYNNAPCGYHSLDKDGVYVEINDTELAWLGYTRNEVVDKLRFTDLLTEEGRKHFRENLDNLKRLGSLSDLEYELCRKDGSTIAVLVSVTVVRDPEGKYAMSRATLYDITARKRTERLLQQSEERFQRIFRDSPYPIVISRRKDLTVVEANEAALALFGFSREEAIGKTTGDLNVWERAEQQARFRQLLAVQRELRDMEARLRGKSGDSKDMLLSAQVIELNGEEFAITTLVDITERKRAERLLEESEARLAKIIEASPEAITIVSVEDGTVVAVNPAGEQLCGYTREELIGNSAEKLSFYLNPEEREAIVADLQRNEVVYGREIRLRRKNAEPRDVLTSAALIDLKGRKFILFQALDITERKSAEKALREHQLMLRELAAHHDAVREGERAHIAREIHDELGQALTALKMELSLVSMKFGEAAPQIREPVEELKERVDAIIQTVRDVATALRPAALDFGILPGVEWLVEEFQKRSGIRCTVSVTGGDIVLGEDRSIVLFRILQESLTNISRHAKARKVEILFDHDAERVRLDVQDDGIGFDVGAARGRKTFGLLGMRERAIMLRGEMNITSAPGRGSRVSVSMAIA